MPVRLRASWGGGHAARSKGGARPQQAQDRQPGLVKEAGDQCP